jgi:alkylation response protein AidB-like acyl-CoA dehydrogenase
MPEQYGGQSMPAMMGSAVTEHLMAANQAFSMYHGLTHGAASTIPAHGTEA